ncbi:MAG: DnaA/Hda family protein [Pirellulaceae bacterium]|nr:DnaA/Hda family protein [Pirellulaceae bacterium]
MAHDVNQSEKDIAAQVRSALVARISSERYELWISPETHWQWNDGVLTLTFESDFACQLVRRMLGKELASVLYSVCGPHAELKLEVGEVKSAPAATLQPASQGQSAQAASAQAASAQAPTAQAEEPSTLKFPTPTATQPNASREVQGREAAHDSPSREKQSGREFWGRFISGASNQLAWTTANMVVSEPGRMTPVLFHGPCGVGKTHLISAIAQQLRSHCRMRRVVHMTSEQFTNDFTEAIKGGGLPMFRRKYRDVEALIIDDVHFLIGKKATLGEFKHTVDNLLRMGKQVILTADRSLNDLQGLGNDVVGRLRGGLVSPLMPIDEKTRAALLQREIDNAAIKIPADVVSQIAGRTVGDGRVLQGIVKRLIAVASQAVDGLTWEQCWNSVYDLVQATQPVVRLGDIERVVCEVFGLAPTSLQSSSKTRTIAQPRMLAMFLARKYTPAAYKEIGDYFGNRRHSTVISAERTVEEWLRDNTSLGDERGLTVRDAIRHVESHLQVG